MSKTKILVLGDKNYTSRDVTEEEPFTGTNTFLLRQMARQVGFRDEETIYHNLYPSNYRLERSYVKGKPASYIESGELCTTRNKLLALIKETKPNVVLATHPLTLYILCKEWNIDRYRGTLMESTEISGLKVIPTFHPTRIHKQWLTNYPVMQDLAKCLKHSKYEGLKEDTRTLVIAPKKKEFINFCNYLINSPDVTSIACDIETQQPGSHISWLGLSASPEYALSFKFLSNRVPTLSTKAEVEVWDAIARVLTCGKEIIFHNGCYDASVLVMNHGIFVKNVFDTMLAMHCLFPQLPRNLGFTSSMYLDVRAWKHTSGEDMGLYNCEDTVNTHALMPLLRNAMEKKGVMDIYKHEISLYPVIMFLGLNGITIDTEKKENIRVKGEEEVTRLEEEMTVIAGKKLNFGSDTQVMKLLYDELKMPVQKKRCKQGKNKGKMMPTVEADALEVLARIEDHEILKPLLRHRKLIKLLTGFVYIDLEPETDKVYTSYNIAGTKEGRLSSDTSIIKPFGSGNLQNIPYEARSFYIGGKGENNGIFSFDFSAAEAKVVAYLTKDERSKEAFAKGYDLHRMAYADIAGGDWRDVSDKDRNEVGKVIRHGMNYGATARTTAKKIGCDMKEATYYTEGFLAKNPQIPIYHAEVGQKLRRDKGLSNSFGRKYPLLERVDDTLLRSMYAWTPASIVGDLTNTALRDFYNKYGDKWSLLLQLHDACYSLLTDVTNVEDIINCAKAWQDICHHPLEIEGDTLIIPIDFSIGEVWGSMKDLRLEGDKLEIKVGKEWEPYDAKFLY